MNKSKWLKAGMIIGAILMFLYAFSRTLEFSAGFRVVLCLAGGILISFCYSQLIYRKVRGMRELTEEADDERNRIIKEKAGYMASCVNSFLIGMIGVIFLTVDYYVPGIVMILLFAVQPFMLILASVWLERNY